MQAKRGASKSAVGCNPDFALRSRVIQRETLRRLCKRGGSNPHGVNRRNLNPVRLPVSPRLPSRMRGSCTPDIPHIRRTL